MHYILLPFSSCLSDLSPSTDYIFLSPPPLLPVFLSPFSLLSPIPRTYLSYFSHSSGISQAFLTLSQTLSKSEITKSDKKKKQAAGNPSSQKNIGSDKTIQDSGKGRAKTGRKAENGSSPKTAERQQDPSQLPSSSQLPPHSSTAHTSPFLFRPCGAAG